MRRSTILCFGTFRPLALLFAAGAGNSEVHRCPHTRLNNPAFWTKITQTAKLSINLIKEAAKALAAGQRMGLDLDYATAIRWITLNPAKALGLDDEIGSLEKGKDADIVIWSGDPFDYYNNVEKVFINGKLHFSKD